MKTSFLVIVIFVATALFGQQLDLNVDSELEDVAGLRISGTSTVSTHLVWNAAKSSLCEDSATYNVYRGTTEDFLPSFRNRIATDLTKTTYTDKSLGQEGDYYYLVKIVRTECSAILTSSSCRAHLQTLHEMDWTLNVSSDSVELWRAQLFQCLARHADALTKQESRDAVDLLLTLDALATQKTTDEISKSLLDDGKRVSALTEENNQCRSNCAELVNKMGSENRDLVIKYNVLVQNYNDLLETARKIANTPPVILTMPLYQSLHCTTMAMGGNMTTTDCY